MRKFTHYCVLMLLLIFGVNSIAQSSQYVFTHQIGTFTPNSTNATRVAAVEADDKASASLPIGFTFNYGGVNYNSFFMSSNGTINFGTVGLSSSGNNLSTASATNRPILAALWDDLDGRAANSVSKASYQVTGSAPNRVLTVEWLNWEWNYASNTPVISFQIKLYETTNVIEYVYKHESGAINGTGSATIGIGDATGSGVGSFVNLAADLTTPTITTTSITTIKTKPADNQIFRFTPPACYYGGSVTMNNITTTSGTLSLSQSFNLPIEVFISDTVPTATTTPTVTIPANVTTLAVNNLLPSKKYNFYIRYTCSSATTPVDWREMGEFYTLCDIFIGNFSENFKTSETGSSSNNTFPYCWNYLDEISSTGYGYVDASATYAKSAPNSYRLYRTNSTANEDQNVALISPETIDLGNGTKQLRFSVRALNATNINMLEIVTSNGVTSTDNFTVLATINVDHITYQEYIIPLSVTTDDYFGFRLVHNGDATTSTIFLDDIFFEDASSCIFPTGLSVSNITTTSATVNWLASIGNSVTGYEYEVRIDKNPGSGTNGLVANGTTTTTSFTTNLLVPSETYYVYVRSTCGTTLGEWTQIPLIFNTLCDVKTQNFVEDFENATRGSANNNTFPLCWSYVDEIATTGYGFVDNTNVKAGKQSYKLYRTNTDANEDQNVILISPGTVDLGNGTKQLRFSVKATSATVDHFLEIVSSNGTSATAQFNVIQSIKINHTTYNEYVIPLIATTDDYFGFRLVHNGTTTASTLYLDDIYYEDLDSCIFPIGQKVSNVTLNSAVVSWDKSLATGVSSYEYEVRTSGVVGSGAVGLVSTGIVTTTSVALNNLTPATDYIVYVRSICNGTPGPWSDFPSEFMTLCQVRTLDFSEDFDTTAIGTAAINTYPKCWSYIDEIASTGYGYVGTTSPQSNKNSYRLYRTNSTANQNQNVTLVSPETVNLGAGTKQVRFSVKNNSATNKDILEVVTLSGNDDKALITVLQTIQVTGTTYKEYIVPIPPTSDDYFGLRLVHNGTTTATTIFVDDIFYEDMSACIYPMNIKATNVNASNATISWDASLAKGVTSYEYEVRTSGEPGSGTLGLVQTNIVNTTSVNLTGLPHSTKYYVYVRSVCGSSYGDWTIYPINFSTLCDVYTTNFYEGFDIYEVGSTTNNNYPYCWSYVNNITTTGYGYIEGADAVSGKNSYRLYRTNSAANANQVVALISPETFNLGNGHGVKQIRFSVKAASATAINKLEIVSSNGKSINSNYTVLDTFYINHTTHKEYIVVIPQTTDDYFGFRVAYNGTTTVTDLNIEDVYYEDAPNCKEIDSRNIVISKETKDGFTVEWTDQFNVVVPYIIEIKELLTGNVVKTITTSAGAIQQVVTGLNASTEYVVTIKADCGSNNVSTPGLPVGTTTLCEYPDFTSYTPALTLCGAQQAKLSATVAIPEGVAVWYDSANSLEPLFEGANFVSDTIVSQDRSFFLRSKVETDGVSVPVGEGTNVSTNIFMPLAGGWGGFKHQYIFTAAELKEWGLGAGPISALKFDILTVGQESRKNFTLAIGATTKTTADGDHIANTALQQVYANASLGLAVGVHSFDFNVPFIWDGISNIVIQINWSNETTTNTYGTIAYHETTVAQTTSTRADEVTANQLLGVINGGLQRSVGSNIGGNTGGTYTSKLRPNTIFVGTGICESPAIEIPVTVTPKPLFELSTNKVVSCENGNSDIVTIATNLGNYDTFTWTPSTGVYGDAVNGWYFTSTTEQEYTLVASQSNGICEDIKTVRVLSGVKPVANPTLATQFDVCKNTITMLDVVKPIIADASIGTALVTSAPNEEISAFVQSAVNSKQQYIYKASELIAKGATTPGYITSLSLETINSGASFTNGRYTVKLKLDANASFAGTNFATGNFSTVFDELNYTHTFSGVQDFVFDMPFYWDGVSNIIVEITQQGQGAGNNAQTYITTVSGTENMGMFASSTTNETISTGTPTRKRLDIKFKFGQTQVTWSPAANLYVDAAGTIPYATGTNAPTVYAMANTSTVFTATLTGANGCIATQDYAFTAIDVTNPTVTNQTFCKVSPVTDVVVTNVPNGAVLNFYTSLTATTPISTISATNTYYVEAVVGNCKSARIPFTATITTLSLPTAAFTQVACGTSTVANLVANPIAGASIVWYDSLTSTTPLASTTPLVDQKTYYAAQTINGCESSRVAVLVTIGQAPAALQAQTISICGAINYGSVQLGQIAGAELVWYLSNTSQTPIPNTSQVTSGTYYVAQKTGGCESARVQILATSQGSVQAPVAKAQTICGGGSVAQLVATGLPNAIIEWYASATATSPLAATTILTSGTYYVAQRVGNCVSNKVAVSVTLTSTSAPIVKPFNLCEGATVADLVIPSTSGVSYNWYLNSTSTAVLPSTQVVQNGYYFVTRVENGCESARTQVQVNVGSRPNSPTGVSPQTFVDYAEMRNIVMDQANVLWYATYDDAMNNVNPLVQNMPLVDGTTYYAVFIGANGCPSLPTPIQINITLGTNDFDLSKLTYYPNPVQSILTIRYQEQISNVEVFDLNGRLVMSKQFDNTEGQLDFSHLSSGTYMLNIKTKESSQFVKIVKK